MKRAAVLLAFGVLASCATPPPPPPPAPAPVRVVRVPDYSPRPVVTDQCGAGALQTLIGRPRTEIPVPLLPGTRRVACTTCPLTRDYVAGRLNILFDQDTGIVREVRCG